MTPQWRRGQRTAVDSASLGPLPAYARLPDREETSKSPTADLHRLGQFSDTQDFSP